MIDSVMVTRNDVLAAAARIVGAVECTPLIETRIRDHRLWLKCESLQTGGSFKLRGATNRLLLLGDEERKRGVVAFSSGNHAQGVAIAAKRLGIKATIVMPEDAPTLKIENTKSHGAEVVLYDRRNDDRVAIAERLARTTGATVVPSFDDPHIIAGQGTVGLEIADQLNAAGVSSLSKIVANCGGGGLASGIALACPDVEVVPVEPEGWDDMLQSLARGVIVPVGKDAPSTMCDAIQTPLVSPITFGILRARNALGAAVSDAEVAEAVRWAWNEHGLTVEPGGAASLAAIIADKVRIVPETVVVLSGGNIDPTLHAKLVA